MECEVNTVRRLFESGVGWVELRAGADGGRSGVGWRRDDAELS